MKYNSDHQGILKNAQFHAANIHYLISIALINLLQDTLHQKHPFLRNIKIHYTWVLIFTVNIYRRASQGNLKKGW